MRFAELIKTASGGIPENLFLECRRCKGLAPNLSGKRTERLLSILVVILFFGVVLSE